MDDGWRPWPPRGRWTAYELVAEWDSTEGEEEAAAFLAGLTEHEWALIRDAAEDKPGPDGLRPLEGTRDDARELLGSLGGRVS